MQHQVCRSYTVAGTYLFLLIVLCGVLLATCRAAVATARHLEQAPVYPVADLRAPLARQWMGRTFLVRGIVVPCMAVPSAGGGPCAALVPGHAQPSHSGHGQPESDPLTIVRVGPPPLVALLKRLPLLQYLVPAPQVLRWGSVATYQVQMRAIPNSICGTSVCDEALLLDAAP